jgi:hypothetical protein
MSLAASRSSTSCGACVHRTHPTILRDITTKDAYCIVSVFAWWSSYPPPSRALTDLNLIRAGECDSPGS